MGILNVKRCKPMPPSPPQKIVINRMKKCRTKNLFHLQ